MYSHKEIYYKRYFKKGHLYSLTKLGEQTFNTFFEEIKKDREIILMFLEYKQNKVFNLSFLYNNKIVLLYSPIAGGYPEELFSKEIIKNNE
jgi:hypothetical protein